MPDSAMPNSVLFGFLFVLARVSGIFVFAPIPGIRESSNTIRAMLSLAITISLFSLWPRPNGVEQNFGTLTAAIFAEGALGLTIGLGVAFVMEALQMAAQVAGLQAGYGYASTIDPGTQADSSVLLIFAQILAGLLFFATGLDREILRVCALSLHAFPPGKFMLTAGLADGIIHLGGGVFTMGLRLALPIVALLGMVDLSLALLGRINAQLQLLTLAFPLKMLAALGLLAVLTPLFQRIFTMYSAQMIQFLHQYLTR
jgi:flagellar biosynthetic protein FliR